MNRVELTNLMRNFVYTNGDLSIMEIILNKYINTELKNGESISPEMIYSFYSLHEEASGASLKGEGPRWAPVYWSKPESKIEFPILDKFLEKYFLDISYLRYKKILNSQKKIAYKQYPGKVPKTFTNTDIYIIEFKDILNILEITDERI